MPAAMNAMGAVTLSLSTRRETSAKTKTMAAKMANSISNMVVVESLSAAPPKWVAALSERRQSLQLLGAPLRPEESFAPNHCPNA